MRHKYCSKLTENDKNSILILHGFGKTPREIINDLNLFVSETAIRKFLKKQNCTPNNKKIERVKICLICKQSFKPKNYRRDKTCSKECMRQLLRLSKLKYTEDDINHVIELKCKNLPNKIIAQKTNVNINKIKNIVRTYNLYLSKQARQENAYHHKLLKNPNAMSDMRNAITADIIKRRIEQIKQTYRSMNNYERFRQHALQLYQRKQLTLQHQLHIERLIQNGRVTKLGMSIDEFNQRLQLLKQDVENKLGTVSTLAPKYGLHFVTACRYFHLNGWGHLLKQMTSQAELDILNYIKEVCPNINIELHNRTIINPLEIDLYIPELKFAIEFNGLYWHSTASGFKRGLHVLKKNALSKAGISLFAIYEDEWRDKMDLIKAMLRWRLKRFNGKTIRASDLSAVVLTQNAQFKDFFNRNHIDGHVLASYAVALIDNEQKIYASMSIRKNYNGELEIARFATNYDYHIYGGFSKLLQYIPRPIVSYSNNRLSDGQIYQQHGFVEITATTNASYWYTDFEKRIWRFQCKRINDLSVLAQFPTEEQQALHGVFSLKLFGDERPLYRIEDYGHRKWLLKE